MASIPELEEQFQTALEGLERAPAPDSYSVFEQLRSLVPRDIPHSDLPFKVRAELFAFSVSQRRWVVKRRLNAEDYYNVHPESDASELLTPEFIDYLEDRSNRCAHPLMQIRYADLAWDLAKSAGRKRNARMAKKVIGLAVLLPPGMVHDMDMVNHRARALSLALVLKDQCRIANAVESILQLEDSIASDAFLGTWGFSYDLVWDVDLGEANSSIKAKIVSDLESRLRRLCCSKGHDPIDPNRAHAAIKRLVCAYRSNAQLDELRLAVMRFEEAIRAMAHKGWAPIVMYWYQVLHRLWTDNGFHDDATRVLTDLVNAARRTQGELAATTHTYTLPWSELYDLASHLCANTMEGSFNRIARYFLPAKTESFAKLKSLDSQFVMSSLSGTTFTGPTDYPIPIANTGAANIDDDGRLFQSVATDFQFSSGYLSFVLDAVHNSFNVVALDVVRHLDDCALFIESQRGLLERGIVAYLNQDYVVSIHLLVPQIEAATRRILEKQGEMPVRPSRRDKNAFQLMTFDQVLNHKLVRHALGEDAQFYFRVLFTDPRGWNLRNHLSHGMTSDTSFDHTRADRVFHAMLILARLRWKERLPPLEHTENI